MIDQIGPLVLARKGAHDASLRHAAGDFGAFFETLLDDPIEAKSREPATMERAKPCFPLSRIGDFVDPIALAAKCTRIDWYQLWLRQQNGVLHQLRVIGELGHGCRSIWINSSALPHAI